MVLWILCLLLGPGIEVCFGLLPGVGLVSWLLLVGLLLVVEVVLLEVRIWFAEVLVVLGRAFSLVHFVCGIKVEVSNCW